MSNIKVGDIISYKTCFGDGPKKQARVEGLTVTEAPHTKYGEEADCVTHDQVKSNMVLFSLDDGHWCYSDQIVLDRKH